MIFYLKRKKEYPIILYLTTGGIEEQRWSCCPFFRLSPRIWRPQNRQIHHVLQLSLNCYERLLKSKICKHHSGIFYYNYSATRSNYCSKKFWVRGRFWPSQIKIFAELGHQAFAWAWQNSLMFCLKLLKTELHSLERLATVVCPSIVTNCLPLKS